MLSKLYVLLGSTSNKLKLLSNFSIALDGPTIIVFSFAILLIESISKWSQCG